MRTRVLFGVGAALILMWIVHSGPVILMVASVVAAALLAYVEFDRLFFTRKSLTRQIRVSALIVIAILTLRQGLHLSWVFLWLPLLLVSIRHVVRSNQSGDFQLSVAELSMELLGFVYVVSLLGFLLPISQTGPHGREYLFLLFLVVFAGDSLAYFVGMRFGQHRLASLLSPKKSLEGAAGGILGSVLAALLWLKFLYSGPTDSSYVTKILFVTFTCSVLAQLSDLFESLMKRSQCQKDSGHFIPGHGGILDRIDGLALSAPCFYFFLVFLLEQVQ